jgi:hypothetical protein
VQGVGVVAADEHDLGVGTRDPRQPRPESGLEDRCCAVRTSITGASVCWTWRGVSGCASTTESASGPRFMPTIAWKFGGCGRNPVVVRSTKSSASETLSSSL